MQNSTYARRTSEARLKRVMFEFGKFGVRLMLVAERHLKSVRILCAFGLKMF